MTPTPHTPSCPECEHGPQTEPLLGRRDFIRVVGTTAAVAAVGGLTPLEKARAARVEKQAQAEALVFELFKTMDSDQKAKLVKPWDQKIGYDPLPARLMTANAPVGKSVIGLEYNRKQVELLDRIFRSISNGEKGYKELSRNGKFDNSGDFESIGAVIYGEAAQGKKFSLVFTGHHLTVRCDGNSEEATAFGGPLYYGHSPSGYSDKNVFYHQTKASNELFASLSAEQKKAAVKTGKWKDEHGTIKPPAKGMTPPGVGYGEMKKDQQGLVEAVMRELLSPYRKEDGDEVMEIIKANGGMARLRLAYYEEGKNSAAEPWTYWRLEGPGFVWSYRALPHIHTFVAVSSKLG